MRVLIFGASIVQGFHDSEGGWADRLKREFLNENKENSVFNLGISGDKTSHLLERFDSEVNARTKRWDSFDKTLIVFSIGTNDSYIEGNNKEPSLSKETFVENYSKLINKAKEIARYVSACSSLPVDESRSAPVSWRDISYFNRIIDENNRALKELCQQEGINFIDINSMAKQEDWNSMLDDGVHPNSDGHNWICQQVKPILFKQLGL